MKSVAATFAAALIVSAAPPLTAQPTSVPPQQGTVVVSPAQTQQRIDGFGASSAWVTPDMSPSDAVLAFSVDAGVGLSLLRIRIAPCDGPAPGQSCQLSTLEGQTAATAQAMGVKVWATPWTPPAGWKSNDSTSDGGTLLPEDEDDYAQALVQFVSTMKSQYGVSLVGVSAQNEPTMATNYDSCVYTSSSLAEFIGNHLGPAFVDAGLVGPNGSLPFGIIAPESVNGGTDFSAFSTQILENGAAYVGTLATHSYGITPSSDQSITGAAAKEYWETEVYDEQNPPDAGIASGLWVATTMSDALVRAGVNAWHYWWLYNYAPNNEGLFQLAPNQQGGQNQSQDPWEPTKRLYVMGNYSRFVRPGFFRVNATPYPADNLFESAFYDAPSGKLVVVSINTTNPASAGPGPGGTAPGTVPVTFLFDGVTTGSWTSWVTSGTQNLEPGDPVTVSDAGAVVYNMPPQSVTTLEGLVTGTGAAVPADAGTSVAFVAPVFLASDGGEVIGIPVAASGGNGSQPPAAGCGLACSAVGLAPKGSDPWRLAFGTTLAVCVLARLRVRRRRAERTGSSPGSA